MKLRPEQADESPGLKTRPPVPTRRLLQAPRADADHRPMRACNGRPTAGTGQQHSWPCHHRAHLETPAVLAAGLAAGLAAAARSEATILAILALWFLL